MAIYKTIIRVTVLSDGPLPDERETGSWLRAVAEDIDVGDSIGDWEIEHEEMLSPADVRGELIAIGNDGDFFADVFDGWAGFGE